MNNYISTSEMTREQWLKERKNFIGGSEVAAILGLSKWRTALDVYNDKITDYIQEQDENPKMKAGRKLEEVIADWYQEETGRKVIRDNKIRIHSNYPFLAGNVDRLILPQNGEGKGVLEIKTTSSFAHKAWGDEIPIDYYCQQQHYLDVLNLNWGDFALLVDGWDFKIIQNIKRDDEFIKIKNERLEKFWTENVLKGIPPLPVTSEEIKSAFPKHTEGKIIQVSSIIYDQVKELKQIQEDKKSLEERENLIKVSIQNEIQDAEKILYNDEVIATWKKDSDSETIDTKKLKSEKPEIFKMYCKQKTGARKFIVKI